MPKVSEFPVAGPILGNEEAFILQGGVDKTVALSAVFAALGISAQDVDDAIDTLNLGSVSTFTQGSGAGQIPTNTQVGAAIAAAVLVLNLGTASQADVGAGAGELPTIEDVVATIVTALDDLNLGTAAGANLGSASGNVPTNALVDTKIGVEAANRATADGVLQDAVDDEATARAAADTALSGSIGTGVGVEAAARLAADTTLQTNIDAEVTARGTAISGEATTRAAADSTLQGNITAEATARGTAVSGEATARAAADTTLQTNITTEAGTRAAADTTLQTNIDAEVTNRGTAISGEATARAAADTTLQDNITAEAGTRGTADTALQGNINAEATARGAADTTLQGNIDTEVTNRGTAVSAEATARAAADTTLQTNINTEATTRGTADTTLQGNITAEATARGAGDTTLQTNITNEATARGTADSTLQNNITGEASARSAADLLLIPLAQKGANSGVATLGAGGEIPIGQVPVGVGVNEVASGDDIRFTVNQRFNQRQTAGLSEFVGRANAGGQLLGTPQIATAVVVADSYGELGAFAQVTARLQNAFNSAGGSTWRSIRAVQPWNSVQGTASTHGLNGYSNIMSNGQVCSITATCDAFDIYYCTAAGSIEVRIDGALVATVSAATGFRWQSATLAYASHAITLTSVGATEPYGGMFHAGTQAGGVQIHGKGHTGWAASYMNDVATYDDGTLRHITNVQPQVVFYELGINDYATGITTFTTNHQTAVAAIKAAAPLASVVLVVPPACQDRNDWATFAAVYHQIASTTGCMLVDTFEALGTFGPVSDPRSYTVDGTHLNARGGGIFDAAVWDGTFGPFVRTSPPISNGLAVWSGPGTSTVSLSMFGNELYFLRDGFSPTVINNIAAGAGAFSAVNLTQLNQARAFAAFYTAS